MTPVRLELASPAGAVLIVDEPCHGFGSADNTRRYGLEIDLSSEARANSIHGVMVDGEPKAVIGASGGSTTVHERSALVWDDRLLVAVGDRVACFRLSPFALDWAIEADSASCFGLHLDRERRALISHGELAIARLDETGAIHWSTAGRDVFTGRVNLLPDGVEAYDFDGARYLIDYDTGEILSGPRPHAAPGGKTTWLGKLLRFWRSGS